MDFLELVNKRYSVRAYKSTPVEDDKLNKILEAARLAPTGANRQAFQLIVVHTAGREAELKPIYNKDWFVQAPVIIFACAVTAPDQPYREAGHYRNIGIVMDHLIMAATDLGLGTCWIGAYDAEAARKILGIPEEAHPVVLATVGYADDQPKERVRKPVDELVRYERW
ncbi:MAG: nitroreductase family protein [Dehalococcoidales bacterium]